MLGFVVPDERVPPSIEANGRLNVEYLVLLV